MNRDKWIIIIAVLVMLVSIVFAPVTHPWNLPFAVIGGGVFWWKWWKLVNL